VLFRSPSSSVSSSTVLAMSESPAPIRLFGEPALVDDDERFGAEEAAHRLTDRLRHVQPAAVRPGRDGTPLLAAHAGGDP